MGDFILRDAISFAKKTSLQPHHAAGKWCLDFTDPITGKIKNRVMDHNHVFPDSLFSGAGYDWVNTVSAAWLCLNDSTAAIDTTFPYMFGSTVGYGIPSNAASGLYRGAYSAANQVLASITVDSVRWKFQYDFDTTQANDVAIGTIGLTHQYSSGLIKQHVSGYKVTSNANVNATCDGRYNYTCTPAGAITKTDIWNGTSSNIDVSATTGTVAGDQKAVGYAPSTGKYYVIVTSSTAGNRKIYVFSDSSFGTLETTYSPTNVDMSGYYYAPFYVRGNIMYCFTTTTNTILRADFVNNVASSSITVSSYNAAMYDLNAYYADATPGSGTCPLGTKYIYCGMSGSSAARKKSFIFDLSTETAAAFAATTASGTAAYNVASCKHPLAAEDIACTTYGGGLWHKAAIAAQVLATPVTKTSANGLTATYEIEVFWDA